MDKKISQLTSATTPLVGTEVLPIVQGGQTVKTTVQAIANLSYQDITYSQLYNKVVNGQLVPGQWYRLTDYKSVNFLNGLSLANANPASGPNFNPREIYEGDTEVLILQATSPYEISEIGYSENYQGDVVTYWPYVNKIGVNLPNAITNGNVLPNSTTVSGFDLEWDGTNVYFNMPTGYPALLGQSFYVYCEFDGGNYYQDGTFQPLTNGISICQFPNTSDDPDYGYPKAMSRIRVENNGQKVVLLDLTQTDYNLYDANTLYVETVYAIGDAYGWIVKRQDTQRNIDAPFDWRGRKYRRFEVDLSGVNAALGTGYWGQGDDFLGQGTTGNYKDLKCFGQDGYETKNIKWLDRGGPYQWNDNNVFLGSFSENEISGGMFNNTAGNGFKENFIKVGQIGGSTGFISNTIISAFDKNQIVCENFGNNITGSTFRSNEINSYSFVSNTITGQFEKNNVQNEFESNVFNNNVYTYFNNFFGTFLQNTVGSVTYGLFRFNHIQAQISSINFTASVLVYGDYNCNLFRRSNGTDQLSYVSGTNVVTYAAVNA